MHKLQHIRTFEELSLWFEIILQIGGVVACFLQRHMDIDAEGTYMWKLS